MIHAYILFVLILHIGNLDGLTTQKFDSKQGCDRAAQTLINVFDSQGLTGSTIWCVPSNGVDDE